MADIEFQKTPGKINKLGFGFLRLPQDQSRAECDWEKVNQLVDRYMELGGRYFDTCYTYLDGFSEMAVRKCVAERKSRDSYFLIEKLPGYLCRSHDDCRRYFEEEQKRCGVDSFDVYMLHWLNRKNYETAEKCDEFRFLRELKQSGKAKRIGFSYHDSAALLDEILTKHPEVDVVLLQINYLDWDSFGIESGKCYETAVKHGKKVFVMEPVKGGTLTKLPPEAEKLLCSIHPDWTPADWALRFVQSLPEVEICLSGMNELSQIQANMMPFEPLNPEEKQALMSAAEIIRSDKRILCTGCRYCVNHCPKKIAIPDYFGMYNDMSRDPDEGWKIEPVFRDTAKRNGKPSDCIKCRSCEDRCPQHIRIADEMVKVCRTFE